MRIKRSPTYTPSAAQLVSVVGERSLLASTVGQDRTKKTGNTLFDSEGRLNLSSRQVQGGTPKVTTGLEDRPLNKTGELENSEKENRNENDV